MSSRSSSKKSRLEKRRIEEEINRLNKTNHELNKKILDARGIEEELR